MSPALSAYGAHSEDPKSSLDVECRKTIPSVVEANSEENLVSAWIMGDYSLEEPERDEKRVTVAFGVAR